VNPFGLAFAKINVRDLIRVDKNGNCIEGTRPVNAAAFAIHSKIHEAYVFSLLKLCIYSFHFNKILLSILIVTSGDLMLSRLLILTLSMDERGPPSGAP
jgi:ribulose-5-phosphate 4-epimerase/fuculose-1-phosphate aldolase